MVAIGPWVIYRSWVGRSVLPRGRTLVLLLLGSAFAQFGGNLGFQYALGTVGLAVTISAAFGTMLVSSAILGRLVLVERLSRQSILAVTLSVGAVCLLGLGSATGSKPAVDASLAKWQIVLGLATACVSGVAYATMALVIRSVVSKSTSTVVVVFISTTLGAVFLGALSLARLGPEGILATNSGDLGIMLTAGGFNLVAFLALVKGLQLTTLLHANVVNASQVALCATAGIALFGESARLAVVGGVVLTIVAVVLVDRPDDAREDAARE